MKAKLLYLYAVLALLPGVAAAQDTGRLSLKDGAPTYENIGTPEATAFFEQFQRVYGTNNGFKVATPAAVNGSIHMAQASIPRVTLPDVWYRNIYRQLQIDKSNPLSAYNYTLSAVNTQWNMSQRDQGRVFLGNPYFNPLSNPYAQGGLKGNLANSLIGSLVNPWTSPLRALGMIGGGLPAGIP